jgi:hypothetical protein
MKIPIIILLSIILSTCATVMNKPITKTTIFTTKPSKIVFKTDTIPTVNNELILKVQRTREPLKIAVLTDSLQKNLVIKSRLSSEFYTNLFVPSGIIGLLVDLRTPKRFTYPNKIYIDVSNQDNKYLTKKISSNHKGDYLFHLSIPYINTFLYQPANEKTSKSTGFWGYSLGLDYYHQNKRFLNLSINGATNIFTPVPASIRFVDDYESFGSTFLSLTNNHKIKRFSFGYGLSFGQNKWRYNSITSSDSSKLKNHNALGFMFPFYLQTGKTFNIGVLYRPTFIRFNTPTTFQYEHLISIDLAWKI